MLRRKSDWEETICFADLYCDEAKIAINDSLYLADDFCKRQINICKDAYEEIERNGFYDSTLSDRQKEFKMNYTKVMEFRRARFLKQDKNREKNKKVKEFLETFESEDDYDVRDSSPEEMKNSVKFRKVNAGKVKGKIRSQVQKRKFVPKKRKFVPKPRYPTRSAYAKASVAAKPSPEENDDKLFSSDSSSTDTSSSISSSDQISV